MRKRLDPRLKRLSRPVPGASPFDGMFQVTGPQGRLNIIVSDGEGWEHVSVKRTKNDRTPSWEEMCFVKELFWEGEEAVIQIHPPRSQYVNNNVNVLHLWRPVGEPIPLPPAWMVGIPGFRTTGVIPVKGGLFIKGFQEKKQDE